MPASSRVVQLTDEERAELKRRLRRHDTSPKMTIRVRIVLLSAGGMTGQRIAQRIGCSEPTVVSWRRRFAELGLEGLEDRQRQNVRGPHSSGSIRDMVLAATLVNPPEEASPDGWSTRGLAHWIRESNGATISHDSVARLWRAFGLRRGSSGTLTFATNPEMVASVRDVVGLYANESLNIVAILANEDQASYLPFRSGIQCLSGALYACEKRGVAQPRNTGQKVELHDFLVRLAEKYPERKLKIIVDTVRPVSCTELQRWLERHYPRMQVHHVSTRSEWLRMVHAFFIAVAAQTQSSPTGAPIADLLRMIERIISGCAKCGSSFSWVKTPDQVLRKARTAAQTK